MEIVESINNRAFKKNNIDSEIVWLHRDNRKY